MEVFKPGAEVHLGIDGDVRGEVVQVAITANLHVQYQVAWWDGRTRRCDWLESFEVQTIGEAPVVPIGFREGAG